MKRVTYVLPLAIFLILALYFAVGLSRDSSVIPSALIDQPAPQFVLPPIEGSSGKGFSTADLKGQVSVVNVFASWCVPCRAEHPLITRLADMNIAAVYGLNYKDKPEAVLAWLDSLGDPYTEIGADMDGRVSIDWGVYGIPETFIIGKGGRIRFKHVGQLTAEKLEKEVLPIIRELNQ